MYLNNLEKRIKNSIWSDIDRLQEELANVFFPGGYSSYYVSYPPVNLYSNQEQILLTALIPGYEPDAIDISVKDNKITLKGNKKREELAEGVDVHRQEIYNRDFIRSIELPFNVDSNRVEAKYKNGVLYVTLPRVEAEKPRKIQVKLEN